METLLNLQFTPIKNGEDAILVIASVSMAHTIAILLLKRKICCAS